MEIQTLKQEHIPEIIQFSNKWIGKNYYTAKDLQEIIEGSGDESCSFIVIDKGNLAAIRLSYAPGLWPEKLMKKCSPRLWKVSEQEAGYFKSLFIHGDYQGKGLGSKLSEMSVKKMQQQGAKAVVCHSWLESPGNSSQKYLLKFGMEVVVDHPNFWEDVDYLCSGCEVKPCICTAREMIKYL